MKTVTSHEFWKCFGIIPIAAEFVNSSASLWQGDTGGIVCSPDMGRYTKEWQFKHIKNLLPGIYTDGDLENTDGWWHFSRAVEDFKNNRKSTVSASVWKVFDETTSASRPQTTKTGGLLHISFIDRKT